MADPLITLRCDCGAEGRVAYGERFTCDACGRSYDTSAIPAEEFGSIARTARRYRRSGWVLAALLAGLLLLVILRRDPVLLIASVPGVLLLWFLYGRPMLRWRYRKAIAERPTWELRAEPPPSGDAPP